MKCLRVIVLLFSASWAAQIPNRKEVTSRCMEVPREDLEPCLLKVINELQAGFTKGISDFHLTPQNEIKMENFNFSDRTNDQTFMDATFENIVMKGIDDTTITNLTLDYDNHLALVKATTPEVLTNGRYQMNASFAVVAVQGKGTFWMRLNSVDAKVKVKFDFPKTSDGEYRFKAEDIEITLDFEKIVLRLNNLFEGEPILKETTETWVQENAREIFVYVQPKVERHLKNNMYDTFREVLGKIPLEEMAGKEYIKKAFNISS